MKIGGYIAAASLIFWSCSLGGGYKTETEANRITIAVLLETAETLEQMNDSAVNRSRTLRAERLKEIEEGLIENADTLDAESAALLKALSESGEPYHPFSVEKGTATARLRRSAAQLEALNRDLTHNLIPADSVRYYVHRERKFAEKALNKAQRLQEYVADEREADAEWHKKADRTARKLMQN